VTEAGPEVLTSITGRSVGGRVKAGA
jgi:hypothetical protein